MSKFFQLVKVFLLQRFRPIGEKDKKKTITTLIILGVCLIPVAVMMFIAFISIGQLAAEQGALREMITYLTLAAQVVVLIFGISSVLNIIYLSKDNILLLAMPISPKMSFAAKLTYVYINETIANLAITLIALIPFGIGAHVAWWYYLQVILVTLLTPLLPLLIASIIAIPLMYLVSFLKNKGVGATIVYLIIFIVCFGGYYYFVFSLTSDITDETAAIIQMMQTLSTSAKYLYPEYLLAGSLLATTFGEYCICTFGSIGIHLGLLVFSVLIASAVYRTSVSKQLEIPKSSKKEVVEKEYKRKGKVAALLRNDLRAILRDSSVGTSCLMSMIIMPVLAAVMSFGMTYTEGTETVDVSGVMPVLYCIIFSFICASCNYVSTSSFSREGTKFFLYKAMPISGNALSKEKSLISTILIVIACFVTAIVLYFVSGLTIIEALLFFVITALWSVGTSNVQVLLDLKNPRLYWNTFIEGCKNNPSQLWGMLVSVIHAAVMFGVGGIFVMLGATAAYPTFVPLGWSMLILFGVCYAVVSYIILIKKSEKIFAHTEG